MREPYGKAVAPRTGPEPWRCAHNYANEIDTDNTHGDVDDPITEIADQPAWKDPKYDAAGNMIFGPKAGFGIETTTEETPLHFVYDAWGRLVAVWKDDDDDGILDDGQEPDDTLVAEYRYDGLNRRIVKLIPATFDENKDPIDWNRTDYYYTASWQVIEERFVADQEDKETVAAKAKFQYVWGVRYIDAAILRDENKNENGDCDEEDPDDQRLYYCQDANFNVTALVDESGTVQERYVYDPYGRVTIYDDDWSDEVDWGDSKKNEILYCGYRYDPESNLYHVRNRYHHPTLGRWLQRDPIGYADGMSLYEYVGSEPVGRLDPMGLAKPNVEAPLAGAAGARVINMSGVRIEIFKTHVKDLRNPKLDWKSRRTTAIESIEKAFGADQLEELHWDSGEAKVSLPNSKEAAEKYKTVGALGTSGFVLGWTLKAKAVELQACMSCDFSGTKYRFMPYALILDRGAYGTVLRVMGRVPEILDAPSVLEHEKWHTEGVNRKRMEGEFKKRGVRLPEKYYGGYSGEVVRRASAFNSRMRLLWIKNGRHPDTRKLLENIDDAWCLAELKKKKHSPR